MQLLYHDLCILMLCVGCVVQDFMDVDRRKEECVIEPEFIRVGHIHTATSYMHMP